MAKRERRLIAEIGERDYDLCREALADLTARRSSGVRIMAGMRWGGRAAWAAVVELWQAGVRSTPQDKTLCFVRYYSDGTAECLGETVATA